jgi:predicted RNA-binding protein YlxR (DUF448 family)
VAQSEVNEEPREPIRTCLGCGKKQPKRLLHRLVLDRQNQPLWDRSQAAPGRGAYLCGPGCLAAAAKRKAFQRAFKTNVALDVATLETAFLRRPSD